MILPLKRLNRLRKDGEYEQNWKAVEDTLSFLGREKAWISERFTFSSTSQEFEEVVTLEVSPQATAVMVGLLIDSETKETSTGLVDGLTASTTGGVDTVIQILRNGEAFARFQLDSGTEAPSFLCLDSSPKSRTFEYTLQARNTGAGNALTITNMRLFAQELF